MKEWRGPAVSRFQNSCPSDLWYHRTFSPSETQESVSFSWGGTAEMGSPPRWDSVFNSHKGQFQLPLSPVSESPLASS